MSTIGSREIKSVRKTHCCEQCTKLIEVGQPAQYDFGIWEGETYSVYTHPECSLAAKQYAELNGLWGEEYPWFQHMENGDHDHHEWLLVNHPIVADRLNIKCEVEA